MREGSRILLLGIIFLGFFGILSNSSSAYYCYKEFVDVSTVCDTSITGSNTFQGAWSDAGNTVDGNYTTFGQASGGASNVLSYYKIPANASLNGSLWQVKVDNIFANYSVPPDCWGTDAAGELRFLINSDSGAGQTQLFCYEAGHALHAITGFIGGDYKVYEEAVFWNYTSFIDFVNFTPINSSFNTNNINIFAQLSLGSNVSCTLYLNGTYNDTQSNVSDFVNFTKNLTEGTYRYNITCYDDFGNSSSPGDIIIFKDSTNPVLTTSFLNLSNINNNGFLRGDFNITDETYLHSFNISIAGRTWYYINSLNGTSFNYSLNYNASNLTGINYLTTTFADGHTAEELKEDYDVGNGFIFENALTFGFSSDNYVRIESPNILDTLSAVREKDRYSFEFKPFLTSETYSFNVKTDFPEIFIANNPSSEYKTWLIMGDKWVDFNLNEGEEVSIERVSRNEVKVNVIPESKGLELMKFNSIGDLNIVQVNYTFYVVNFSETYISPVVEQTTNLFTLNVSVNTSYISDVNAILNYNGTPYTPTKSNMGNWFYFYDYITTPPAPVDLANFSFNWTISTTGITNNTFYTNLHNQTAGIWNMSNCSLYSSYQILNFTFKDAVTGRGVTASTDALVVATVGNLSKTFDLVRAEDAVSNSSSFCMIPNGTSIQADEHFIFVAPFYNTVDYYTFNSTLISGTPTNVTIYFVNFTAGTTISVFILDSNNVPAVDYIVEAYLYDLGTNSFLLHDTEETDENGLSLFNLYVADNEFKFIVKNQTGGIVFESAKMKLFSNTYTFRLTSSAPGQTLFAMRDAFGTCPITYTPATQNMSVNWTDISVGSQYQLNVYWTNGTNSTPLSIQNTTNHIGSLSFILPTRNGTIMGNFNVVSSTDGQTYLICSYPVDRRPEYQVYGVETLLYSVFMIGSITFLGIFSPDIALVFFVVAFIFMYFIGFMNIGTGLMGIVVLVILLLFKLKRGG